MDSKILVIVPADLTLGFKLTGVDTQGCVSDNEAGDCLEKELSQQKYNIIIIDEKFIFSFGARLNKKIQDSKLPLILALPLKTSFKDEPESKDYFLKMVQDAIGYEIRIK